MKKDDRRVLRSRIRYMTGPPAIALACALQARRLRHAIRCNCGRGYARPGCTRTIELTWEQHKIAASTLMALALHAARAREVACAYRANRTWIWRGPRTAGGV